MSDDAGYWAIHDIAITATDGAMEPDDAVAVLHDLAARNKEYAKKIDSIINYIRALEFAIHEKAE